MFSTRQRSQENIVFNVNCVEEQFSYDVVKVSKLIKPITRGCMVRCAILFESGSPLLLNEVNLNSFVMNRINLNQSL